MSADLFSLAGRVAVVTGAASGLGQAIAVGFARAGAFVVCADRDATANRNTARQISDAAAFTVDVQDRQQAERAIEQIVAEHTHIDILVNSAGIGGRGPADDYPEELWQTVVNVNLTGSFNMCQAVGRHMLARGRGSIVNIASIGGLVGFAGSVGYQASKGGVVQMTRSLAVEWGARGVRVNAIAPCQFETPMVKEIWEREPQVATFFRERTPIGRIGQPADIVGPAIFLASDASAMVIGHVLAVDGGYTAQ